MKRHRYLVFAGEVFYPSGGWNDFLMSTDDPAKAIAAAKDTIKNDDSWAHVIDLEVQLPVWRQGMS